MLQLGKINIRILRLGNWEGAINLIISSVIQSISIIQFNINSEKEIA